VLRLIEAHAGEDGEECAVVSRGEQSLAEERSAVAEGTASVVETMTRDAVCPAEEATTHADD
jgi:hypothetical protein